MNSIARLAATSLLGFAYALPSHAVYNANMTGVVTDVLTYPDSDQIFFRLQNQPTSNGTCTASYFAIASDVSEDRRNRLLAHLLAAKYAREPINIGYDNSGDCAHGFIRVHRIG